MELECTHPSSSSSEEAVPMHSRTDDGQEQSRHPYKYDRNNEPPIRHPIALNYTHPRMDTDGQDEEPTRHIPNVQEPRLNEARRRRSQNLAQP